MNPVTRTGVCRIGCWLDCFVSWGGDPFPPLQNENTPLHLAACYDEEGVKMSMLLAAGADTHAKTKVTGGPGERVGRSCGVPSCFWGGAATDWLPAVSLLTGVGRSVQTSVHGKWLWGAL